MAHQVLGIKKAEATHHSQQQAAGHDHSHGEAAAAARSAGFWLFITLLGGLLVLTSFFVQWSEEIQTFGLEWWLSHLFNKFFFFLKMFRFEKVSIEYQYQFHMDLAAGLGASLLALRIGPRPPPRRASSFGWSGCSRVWRSRHPRDSDCFSRS